MRLLLNVVFLLVSAHARAADPYPEDACRYLEDVRGVARADCFRGSPRVTDAEAAAALDAAPARRMQVTALARRLAIEARDPSRVAEFLSDPANALRPPLTIRTLDVWLEPADASRPSEEMAEAIARWGRLNDPATAPARRPAVDGALTPRLGALDSLRDADAAALIIDGAAQRDEMTLPRPEDAPERGARARDERRPPQPSERVARSDLELMPPPLPTMPSVGVPLEAGPLFVPGVEGSRESLLLSIDPAVSPCQDFYQHACGRWIRDHPLNGASERSRTQEMHWRNRALLRFAVEDISRAPAAERTPDERRLADYYAACMDRAAVNRRGLAPLLQDLAGIRAAADLPQLARALGNLHATGLTGLFSFGAQQDRRNGREIIASFDAAGSGMPRAYFTDPAQAEMRTAYAAYARALFMRIGEGRSQAVRSSEAVLRVETALASVTMLEEEQRDSARTYNRMRFDAFAALAPSFAWQAYLEAVGAPRIEELNVSDPGYFRGLERLLTSVPLEDWRSYLAWRVIYNSVEQLPDSFAEERSRFNNLLWGSTGRPDRAGSCLSEMERAMGDALGLAYTSRYFDATARQAVLDLTQGVRASLIEAIRGAAWMSQPTRELALAKAGTITLKVGYPERASDTSSLNIARGDAYGNMRRAGALRRRQDLARIGRPRDAAQWGAPAHVVNAFYDPQNNEVTLPAGILQPPFFDPAGSPAVNYGAVGALVGHELVHGFDDEGRRFDAEGNMRDWWTPEDARAYMERAGAFVRQYAAMPQTPGGPTRVNGELTLGENIADNGGLRLAYTAFRNAPDNERGSDGFTAEQTFFLSFARSDCGHSSPQQDALFASFDPHAPMRARVNGSVSNMPEFAAAFRCAPDAPMVNRSAARVW